MKLLFLSNILPSPLHPTKGTFNLGLLRALVDVGHEPVAIAPVSWLDWMRASSARRHELRTAISFLGSMPVTYPVYFYTPGLLRSSYGAFMWNGIRKAVEVAVNRHRPQAIVSYWAHPDGYCAIRAARKFGLPAIVMVGGSDVLLLTSNPSQRRAIYSVLNDADAVVAVSNDLKEKIVANGVSSEKVHVVRRGIDTKCFNPTSQQAAHSRLGLSATSRILLWVGRMEPVKGLPTLLKALHRLNNEGVRPHTILIGSGTEANAIATEVARLDLTTQITMLGKVPHAELADYYRAADFTVLPSLSEGVPNVLLESIACGTPFIASRVGGVPEIASPGIDRLVPPDNPESLAAAIREALSSTETHLLRSFVPEDWPTAASRLIDVIQPFVGQTSPRSLVEENSCLTPTIV